MLEMSNLKAAWHLERIQQLRDGQDTVPLHVQFIISDLCNQDCHFCAYRMETGFSIQNFPDETGSRNPHRMIPFEKTLEILDDCSRIGVQAIEFTGGGEPTVHPKWTEIVSHAQDLHLSTGLVTNGIRLKPARVLERLTWLRISLDAGTQATYERTRRSRSWHQVLKALELVGSLSGPLVGVGFVVTRDNYSELTQAAYLAKRFGIPYIRVSAMFSTQGDFYYSGCLESIRAGVARTKDLLEDDKFKVVDFFDDRIADLRSAAPDYKFCGYQQFVLYIGGDLKVYTCCTNAYTDHGVIGDLREQSFAGWLKGHRRYDFDARKCHHCQFNDKNRVVNYMISKPPHVEFV